MGRSTTADSAWGTLDNEYGDDISEVCWTTGLGSCCNKFDKKIILIN